MEKFDFSGWATRNNRKCSDGRTIMKDAFKDNDGQRVPLVWNHQHNDSENVLGHALLENRDEGVYAYCSFNDTARGQDAKTMVEHGDITALSIYANKLKQNSGNVIHGVIREVSLVLAGANPGAYIDSIMSHGESSDEEAVIYSGEDISLYHADEDEKEEPEMEDEIVKNEGENNEVAHSETEKVSDPKKVFSTLNEEQKNLLYAMVAQALKENNAGENNKEDDNMIKHNVFEANEENNEAVLSHSDMENLFKRGKQLGSLREAVDELCHSGDYGIDEIDMLFPEAKNLNNPRVHQARYGLGWRRYERCSSHAYVSH